VTRVVEARWPWPLLVAAAIVTALGLNLWFGRETTFTVDDLVWFITSPGLDADTLLEPHNGHLIAVARLIHHIVYEAFGADYGVIRLLTALAAGATGAVFFAWTAPRIGRPVALVMTALLLLMGTSYVYLIAGDGLMVQLSLATGIGALLALDRDDARGDTLACALLTVGVLTYSLALAFLVAAAVHIVLSRSSPRRLWVPALPTLIYVVWWLWAQGNADAPSDQLTLSNLLVAPAYAFQSLASALGAVTGLDYQFGRAPVRPEFDTTNAVAGAPLAVVAIGCLGWRLSRAPLPRALSASIALLLALWLMGAATADAASPPDATRFVFFIAVAVLMVGAASVLGAGLARRATIVVGAVLACGVAANTLALHDGGEFRRDTDAPQMRAELTGIELAGANAVPLPDFARVGQEGSVASVSLLLTPGDDPTGQYLEAVASYGGVGYTVDELRREPEHVRAFADQSLLAAYGTTLEPATEPPAECEPLKARPEGAVAFELPQAGVVIETSTMATVSVRRFATQAAVPVGELAANTPATIRIPADADPSPWYASVGAGAARVCPL
jgi:hypothetical protein